MTHQPSPSPSPSPPPHKARSAAKKDSRRSKDDEKIEQLRKYSSSSMTMPTRNLEAGTSESAPTPRAMHRAASVDVPDQPSLRDLQP